MFLGRVLIALGSGLKKTYVARARPLELKIVQEFIFFVTLLVETCQGVSEERKIQQPQESRL